MSADWSVVSSKSGSSKATAQCQQSKFDMSKQTCNYCKGKGHRIHAMNAEGVYILGMDGERILACPVLIKKEAHNTKRIKNVDEEFPALPGQSGGASAYTVVLVNSIDNAIKEKKHREWLLRKAQKEARELAKAEQYAKEMETKYGPRWAWVVMKTDEDNSIASSIRYDYMVATMEREAEEDRLIQESERQYEEQEKKKREERKARRALMSAKDASLDKEDEALYLEAQWESDCLQNENMQRIHSESIRREKETYAANGWTWVERY